MTESSNKTIAKNTLFLYVRMILTLGVSLYTSRVVLNVLGVEDYGIYNLVGGIVVLFSFINRSLTSATQRFISYEMGKNDQQNVHKVFCISVNIYIIIVFVIIILAETIGLWFLNNKLNIPIDRMSAANVVYQFTILTFVVNTLKVPYNASVVAYEKMSFYAWSSILEVFLKLIVVFTLLHVMIDKLILYAMLTFIVSIIVFTIYHIYCRIKFDTCRYKFMNDKKIMNELLNFSGWSIVGSVADISSKQGVDMILNIFIGVTINASLGIANQVNTALYSFISNFSIAFQPQIIKTYSSGNINAHKNLLFQTSKFSYFLLLILATPVLLNTSNILSVWLNIVPDYAVTFTQITILLSLFEALSISFWMSISATGKIKQHQMFVFALLLLNLPLSYLLLLNGFSPELVLLSQLGIRVVLFVFRVFYVKRLLKFTLDDMLKNLFIQVFYVTVSLGGILLLLKQIVLFEENVFLKIFFQTLVSIALITIVIIIIGVNKVEREALKSFVFKKYIK